MPESEAQTKAAQELGEAFARYFAYRADLLQRNLNELFRVGRRSLAIGVPIFVACLVSAHIVNGYLVEAPFRRLVEESFLILGWVANWRPLEIFLYDWWPLGAGVICIAALPRPRWRSSPIEPAPQRSAMASMHAPTATAASGIELI